MSILEKIRQDEREADMTNDLQSRADIVRDAAGGKPSPHNATWAQRRHSRPRAISLRWSSLPEPLQIALILLGLAACGAFAAIDGTTELDNSAPQVGSHVAR